MPKSLRTFIEDCQRELPGEVIHITKEVNPANYDVTAIIKHLGAQKKFPIIIFDNPLNLNGKVGPIKLTMNCEISQGKTQIALGMPRNEDLDSGGSQFFVTHRPTPHLDGRYTIFGELRAGFDVLDAIEVGDRIETVRRISAR